MAKSKGLKLSEFECGWHLVLCPECEYEYVHIKDVSINRNGNVIYVRNDVTADLTKVPSTARGAIIAIGMWCEQGHEFSIFMQFHKGNTFVWTEHVRTFDSSLFFPSNLWRD